MMEKKVLIREAAKLRRLDEEISTLAGISALLGWDKDTILPRRAFRDRGEHIAYVSRIIHEKMISDELWQSINRISRLVGREKNGDSGLDRENLDYGMANIMVSKVNAGVASKGSKNRMGMVDAARARKLKRECGIARRIPPSHIEEMARVSTAAFEAWGNARKKRDFRIFGPHLKRLVELKRREAAFISRSTNPYEVLCDLHEEGITLKRLDGMFDELRWGIGNLLDKISSSRTYKGQNRIDGRFKNMVWAPETQQSVARGLSALILGEQGRTYIGESIHPFMTRISFDDVRMTTTVRETEPMFAFSSVAHESGHALYELQIDEKVIGSILCTGASTALHESQSRLWENQICLSEPFWEGYFSVFKKKFPCLKGWSRDQFYRVINRVRPSQIRIESDELTYTMHIIIRYEIEKALIDGTLEVERVKQRWNELYMKYLGVKVRHDTEGILQDVHWTDGSFGYFPTYALGNVYSAMLFRRMSAELNHIEQDMERGEFDDIKAWLREKVHRWGAVKMAPEIIKEVCGCDLDTAPYLNYLRGKFGGIYGLRDHQIELQVK